MGNALCRRSLLGLALLLALDLPSPILAQPAPIRARDNGRLVFWNVGQGDFISLVSPQVCWIFDVGGSVPIPAADLVYLRDHCPERKALLFVSHFDKDHIRNYGRLVHFLDVTDAYFSHLTPRSSFGKQMLLRLRQLGVKLHRIRAGFTAGAGAGSMKLRCVWPPPDVPLRRAENDRSLVFLLKTPAFTALMTGDLPSTMEKKLPPLEADILKVGHHGSRYSSSSNFLKALHPKSCVVSVGAHNSFGHPNPEALRRLAQGDCAILRTDKLGDISFSL